MEGDQFNLLKYKYLMLLDTVTWLLSAGSQSESSIDRLCCNRVSPAGGGRPVQPAEVHVLHGAGHVHLRRAGLVHRGRASGLLRPAAPLVLPSAGFLLVRPQRARVPQGARQGLPDDDIRRPGGPAAHAALVGLREGAHTHDAGRDH